MTACSTYADNGLDTDNGGPVWSFMTTGGFTGPLQCWPGSGFLIDPSTFTVNLGQRGQWVTITPPSIQIIAWRTADPPGAPAYDHGVLVLSNIGSFGFNASFYYNGGTTTIYPGPNCCASMAYAQSNASTNAGFGGFLPQGSRYFGWQVACLTQQPCDGTPYHVLSVHGISLTALDNQPPTVTPVGSNNVLNEAGHWIRGAGWNASFKASDDSGICLMKLTIGSQTPQTLFDWWPNPHSWTQCWASQTINQVLDTTQYPNGALPVTYYASDAASPANQTAPSATVDVDNAPVGLTLSGPTNAPSTAGTQYITATATSGPSGAEIACSLDGASYSWHPGSAEQIPVGGVGVHQLSCYAQNRALDVYGNPARSATAMWALKIGRPSIMGITFSRVVDALRCARVHVRLKVPGHWITVRRHHHTVRVHTRAHYRRRTLVRCHARTGRRRVIVWKTVVRHGRKVRVKRVTYVRVVRLPHIVNQSTRRVGFGHATTVSGWLGTSDGTALGGRTVAVLTAPDNGSGGFSTAAVVTTQPNGAWSANLPAGPSRIVEALYAGDSATEGTVSGQVRVTVPAKVTLLRVRPRHVRWGGTVHISGQLLGGYLPPGGALVRLRIGIGTSYETYGVQEHVSGSGRFATTYTFGLGLASQLRRYWFQVATLPMGNYPYAPASSAKVSVLVGGQRRRFPRARPGTPGLQDAPRS